MSDWIVTLEDAARALGLKKKGSEYKGPCPICSGNDRFHIMRGTRGQAIVVHCRHGCKYPDLMREMESRGLVSKSEYDREKWRQQKADEVLAAKKWELVVFESNIKNGHQMNWEEKQKYHRLKKYIEVVENQI